MTVRFKINPSPLIRATHDAATSMRNMAADVAGKPRPPRMPYPKRHSGMTARQYRADRRRYQRETKAYKLALRTWTPDRAPLAATMRALAAALRPKQTDFALVPPRQESA